MIKPIKKLYKPYTNLYINLQSTLNNYRTLALDTDFCEIITELALTESLHKAH